LTHFITRPTLSVWKKRKVTMAGRTVTRADLSDAVYEEVGLSRDESGKLVVSVLEYMSSALADGVSVKLSSFGSFTLRNKALRIGRNPKTGEEVPITPRRVVVFRASHVLKERMNRRVSGNMD
jgi:integration host factor subunit alpha